MRGDELHGPFSGSRTNKECLLQKVSGQPLLLPEQHERLKLDSRQALGGRQDSERRQGWSPGSSV